MINLICIKPVGTLLSGVKINFYLLNISKLLVTLEHKCLDAFDRKKQLQTAGAVVTNLDILAAWETQDAVQICTNDETPWDFLAGFLPGASFFLALREWFSMLRWQQDTGETLVFLILNWLVISLAFLP